MENRLYSLTNPQKAILLTEQYYKNTNINNVCGTFYSEEKLDFEILKRAINIFLKNNDSFKIKLILVDNEVKQYFSEMDDIYFEIVDIKSEQEQADLERRIASKTFDIMNSLLFEIVLFRYPDNHGGFVINSHHIISDSWTNGILVNNIALIYSKLKNEEAYINENKLSYKDYIQSESEYIDSPKFEKDKKYWSDMFSTVPEVATIPSSKDMSKSQFEIEARRSLFKLDEGLLKDIRLYCDRNNVSLYNFFMAIFALYIGKVSNLDEFVIGTPVLNRTNFREKQTTGMYINTLPLKVKLLYDKTFLDNLRDIAINSMSLLRHQKYSFQYILEDIHKKDSSIPKLYNVMYSYQNTKMNENEDALAHTATWIFNNAIADDIDIHMFEWNDNNTIEIAYDYRISMYDEQDIKAVHTRILHIINQILQNENIMLSDIAIVDSNEYNKIILEFNSNELEYDSQKTLIDLFEEQVKAVPNNIAVKYEDEQLTYRELYEKVCNCAYYLRQNGVKNNSIVSLLIPRSIEMIIGILSVVKAGGCYNPIDIRLSKDRIMAILTDCNPTCILSTENYCSEYKNLYNCIDVKEIKDIKYTGNLPSISKPNDLSYIIYTSGSTGTPKGVAILNKNIVGLLSSIKEILKTTSNDVVSMFHTYCFDVSVMETYNALTNGAKLVVLSDEDYKNPFNLLKLLRKEKVTILQQTPSYFYKTVEYESEFEDADLALHTIILAGEQVQSKNLLNFKLKYPNIKIYNGYGPTETTILSTMGEITEEEMKNNEINIGKALYNYKAYILDKHLKPVPIGCRGRLYIGGIGVSNGYLNREELTRDKFIQDPFNGNIMYDTGDIASFTFEGKIEFWGRIDEQVKVNGYRVELEEIQSKMLEFNHLEHPVVISIKDEKKGSNFLVAFYLSNKEINKEELKQHLSNLLPSYEVPSYFIRLDQYPHTISGKVDKKKLVAYFQEYNNNEHEVVLPSNHIEQVIYDAISSINNMEVFSVTDNFKDIGMDSLNILSALIKLKTFNFKAQDFYDFPTVQLLAKKVQNNISLDIKQNNAVFKNLEIPNTGKEFDLSSVLITGTTGYLGIHILNELINNQSVEKIYCLIRSKNYLSSAERLNEKIKYYFGSLDTSKIEIVEGELTKNQFGLKPEEYKELLNKITTVINAAANVNHIGNYDYFYNDNVNTVKNIIEFCKESNAGLAHISTVSIAGYVDSQKHDIIDFTENMLYEKQKLYNNVYLITKLLAETEIIESINKFNINAKIFRLGNIMPRYLDGVFQSNKEGNAFMNRLISLLHIGKLPVNYKEYTVELSPVDFCSKAIVELLSHPDSQTIYHIDNPNQIKLVDLLEKLSNNKILVVETKEFNDDIQNYPINYTKYLFEMNTKTHDVENRINNDRTVKKLKDLKLEWPNYTQTYIEYIRKFVI